MSEGQSNPNAAAWVSILAAIAIVGIYWYYSQKADKRMEAMYSGVVKNPGMGSSNHAQPPHMAEHENSAVADQSNLLFPKDDPKGD